MEARLPGAGASSSSSPARAAGEPAPHLQRVGLDEADEEPLLREEAGLVSGDEGAQGVVGGDAEECVGDVDPEVFFFFFRF